MFYVYLFLYAFICEFLYMAIKIPVSCKAMRQPWIRINISLLPVFLGICIYISVFAIFVFASFCYKLCGNASVVYDYEATPWMEERWLTIGQYEHTDLPLNS